MWSSKNGLYMDQTANGFSLLLVNSDRIVGFAARSHCFAFDVDTVREYLLPSLPPFGERS